MTAHNIAWWSIKASFGKSIKTSGTKCVTGVAWSDESTSKPQRPRRGRPPSSCVTGQSLKETFSDREKSDRLFGWRESEQERETRSFERGSLFHFSSSSSESSNGTAVWSEVERRGQSGVNMFLAFCVSMHAPSPRVEFHSASPVVSRGAFKCNFFVRQKIRYVGNATVSRFFTGSRWEPRGEGGDALMWLVEDEGDTWLATDWSTLKKKRICESSHKPTCSDPQTN